jgi:hypothetical protein
MVFIDGDHEYESVRADLLAWIPKVLPTGLIAAHDNFAPSVQRALGERTDLMLVEVVESTNVYRRRLP